MGRINIYGPITDITGTFNLVDSILVEATETSITGIDLLGDDGEELIIGQRAGGLYFLEKVNNTSIGFNDVKPIESSLKVYPNPTSATAAVIMPSSGDGLAQLRLTDLQGRVIHSNSIRVKGKNFEENIDLRTYPSGVYLVSVIENDTIRWAKLIKE